MGRVELLGVGFDNVNMSEAVEQGVEMLLSDGTHYVVTPNPEIVETCRENPAAKEAVTSADLVIADGIGVIYGSRIRKTPLKCRVPGIEFGEAMVEQCVKLGKSVYFLGCKPGIAEKAAENLKTKYPGLQVVGTADGYFKDDAAAAAKVRESGADLLFVCLGAPKQERWIAEFGPQTGAHLMVGLGGVLDVYAGNVKRAPAIWQKMGLEWFYRLVHQPSRFGRMAKLPLFLVDAKKESKKRGKA